MKVIYVLLCLPALLASQTPEEIKTEWRNQIAPYERVCAKESGADLADIRSTWDTFIYSKACGFKCYFRCLYKKLGFLYKNRSINVEAMVGSVVGLTNIVTEQCLVPYGTCPDECQRLWAFDHCLSDLLNLTTVKLKDPPCSVSK